MEFMPKLILTKKAGRRPTTLFIYKRIHQDLKFLGPEVVPTYMLGRRIFRIREIKWWLQFTSVQFSHPVMSNSLWPHELQHTRFSCPSLTPGVCSNTSPLSQWCLPTISSSVPFSSCLQSFPASGSFPGSQFFTSGGQTIGISASACPSKEYSGLISFKMDWLDLPSVQGTLKSLLQDISVIKFPKLS